MTCTKNTLTQGSIETNFERKYLFLYQSKHTSRTNGNYLIWVFVAGVLIRKTIPVVCYSHVIAWPQDFSIYGICPTIISININIQYDK